MSSTADSAHLADLGEHLFQSWPDPVLVVDAEGQILASNPAAAGLNPEKDTPPVGKSLFSWLSGDGASLRQTLAGIQADAALPTMMLMTFRVFEHPLEARILALPGNQRFLLSFRLQRSFDTQSDLNHFFELSRDLICLVGIDGYYRKINGAFEELLGYPRQELLVRPVAELIHPDDLTSVTPEQTEELLRKNRTIYLEQRYRKQSGGYVWLSWTFSSISAEGLMYGVGRDITAHKQQEEALKQLNQELVQQTGQLTSSNRDLERFAYIASHDLQEPLRMVSSFLQLLKRKYENQLDETANKYIHFAVDGADRMKRLIEDLLMYSRVTNGELELKPTSLDAIVQEVRQLLHIQIQEAGAEIVCHELPTVMGNHSQLEQLMQNLISNAVKYRAKERPLKLEIGARRVGQEWEISLQDNGIGIEEAFFEKIFIIFQRLHNKSEFSGTGIGLALCSKIVTRHGGRIWVESQLDAGSRFLFTLPISRNLSQEAQR